jgi:hypothetical protein
MKCFVVSFVAALVLSVSQAVAQVKDWRPFLSVGKAEVAPVIDGNLNDKCWRNGIVVSPFLAKNASMNPYEATRAYVCYDSKNLYVAFKCNENNLNPDYGLTHKIVARSNVRDDKNLWKDDCVELFLRPNVASKNYYHLIVNTINNIYDSSYSEGVQWNSHAKVKVGKTKKFWTVEMAVPLSSLGNAKIKDGSEWLVNFCREQKSFSEDSCWSPTFGSFLKVEHLGRMVFSKNVPEVVLPNTFEKLNPGENNITLSVRAKAQRDLQVTTNVVFENGKTFATAKKYRLTADKLVPLRHDFILDEAQMNNPKNSHFKFNYQLKNDGKLLYQSAGFIQSTEKYSPLKTEVFLYGRKKDLFLAQDSAHILRWDIQRAKNVSGNKIKNLELQIKLPVFIEIVNPLDGKRDYRSNPPLSFVQKRISVKSEPYNLYIMKFSPNILFEMGRKSKEPNQFLLMLHTKKKIGAKDAYNMYYKASAAANGKKISEPERMIKIKVMKVPEGKKPKRIVILEWSTGMTRHLHWLTEKEKSLMFRNWKNAGFNVKALHEFGLVLYPANERAQIRKYGIKIMRGLPTNSQNIFDRKYINMFLGADKYLKLNPQYKAVNNERKRQAKIICSTHVADPNSKYQKEFASWVGMLAKNYECLMFDHEVPVFKHYSCCFCPRCLKEFAKQYKITGKIKRWHLLTRYKDKWVDFKCRQNARIMALIKKYAHQANPNCKLYMYCGYEKPMFHSHAGINFKYCNNCVDVVTCGYGRPLDRINKTKKLIAPTPLVGGELIWWRHGGNYDLSKLRPRLFRRITDSLGGMFLFYSTYVDGRFWNAVGDISRLVSEYEDFFIRGRYGIDLVQVDAGGTAEDIAVLKNSANERLIFVFNATDNKRSFELKNKLLPVNSTCFDYYTGEQFNNPDNLQVTVPPQDVKVIIIKK